MYGIIYIRVCNRLFLNFQILRAFTRQCARWHSTYEIRGLSFFFMHSHFFVNVFFLSSQFSFNNRSKNIQPRHLRIHPVHWLQPMVGHILGGGSRPFRSSLFMIFLNFLQNAIVFQEQEKSLSVCCTQVYISK